MGKKILYIFIATFAFLELLVRGLLIVPAIFPWEYLDETVFVRRSFEGVVPVNSDIELKKMWRWASEGVIPTFIDIKTDSNGFRLSEKGAIGIANSGLLLLGDSVSFGWPYSFDESHLGRQLHSESGAMVQTCSFMGAGPVVLKEVLKTRCGHKDLWKKVVLQLTINNSYSFPDVFFLDRMGKDFHARFSYLLFNRQNSEVNSAKWFELSESELKKMDDFSEMTFNGDNRYFFSHALRFFWMVSFYRPLKSPQIQMAELASLVSQDSLDQRVQATYEAILDIQSNYAGKFSVYLHYTHPGALQGGHNRPEVQLLKRKLLALGIEVYDQAEDPDFLALKSQYYLPQDLHPNRVGYEFFGKKLQKIFGLENLRGI